MPSAYDIYPEYRLALAVNYGQVHFGEILKRLHDLVSNRRWRPGYAIVSCYREADLYSITTSKMKSIARRYASLPEQTKGSRVVIITPPSGQPRMMLWEGFCKNSPLDVKSCLTCDCVRDYLKQDIPLEEMILDVQKEHTRKLKK
jgi:hypothetical protein